ncbi:MAG: hypothetical protein RMH77_01210 [Sulfolobales archaeon]|nr:hypothetical protein [Sulfolobales archaeon]MCX8186255.1 hypothetical protein [Sulfolobales archaeon]MDW7969009.1 hypothetical protein [Sulfolobales archaeon]
MPKGDLLDFIRNEVRGVVYHNSILDEVKLSGRSYPRSGRYLIEVDEPQLDALYLTIIAVLNEPVNKVLWKVGIDGLNITREFKPQVVNESSIGSIYTTHVFDLSKVVKGGKTYTLTISCDSSKPVAINGLELVGVKRVETVSTELSYKAGCVLLNPSETYSLKSISPKVGPYNISLFMNIPSRNAFVDIALNDVYTKTINNLLGLNNVQLSDIKSFSERTLTIKHRDTAEMYHPRFVGIYSVLEYNVSCRGPELNVTLDDVSCVNDSCRVFINIRNDGDIACDNVMIVGFSAGNMLIRDVISTIKPGEEIRKTYNIGVKGFDNRLVIKVVYRRFGKQIINEAKLTIPLKRS